MRLFNISTGEVTLCEELKVNSGFSLLSLDTNSWAERRFGVFDLSYEKTCIAPPDRRMLVRLDFAYGLLEKVLLSLYLLGEDENRIGTYFPNNTQRNAFHIEVLKEEMGIDRSTRFSWGSIRLGIEGHHHLSVIIIDYTIRSS